MMYKTLLLLCWSMPEILAFDRPQCRDAPILSTCRLPSHYSDRVDRNYYQKFVDARGIPVLGTWSASDAALLEAARLIARMVERAPGNYVDQIVLRGDRIVVLGRDEKLHDLPEFRNGRDSNDKNLLDRRGYNSLGVVVCAEENLLCNENDDYQGYSVCMHEFAHALDASFTHSDPAYKRLVVTAFRAAVDNDNDRLWTNTYAASDPAEYFAELSVVWFDAGSKEIVPGSFNGIWSRQQLKNYDQFMAGLLTIVYGDGQWRYSCADICRGPFSQDFRC